MADILFKTDDYIFYYRVGGVLIHNDKMHLQRVPGDDGYAFIGGHVAFGETTAETLVREFKEEIRADIKVERLLMVERISFLGENARAIRSTFTIWCRLQMKHNFRLMVALRQ